MKTISSLAILATITFITPASADKLDDFKDAVSRAGCDSIPYSDLRRSCRSQQSDVHPWCDGSRGPVTCDAGTTGDLRAKLVNEQRRLEELKDKRRELEEKRSRAADDQEKAKWTAELEALEKDTEASKKRLEDVGADLEKRKDFVDKATNTIGKCIDYRRAVMNIFAYATDKVRGENDADVKPYADRLREKYPQDISGHELQITNKTNALEKCNKERP